MSLFAQMCYDSIVCASTYLNRMSLSYISRSKYTNREQEKRKAVSMWAKEADFSGHILFSIKISVNEQLVE